MHNDMSKEENGQLRSPTQTFKNISYKSVLKMYVASHTTRQVISHTPISKNVVGENDECQLSNGD